jgi:hypothetical protein
VNASVKIGPEPPEPLPENVPEILIVFAFTGVANAAASRIAAKTEHCLI